MPKVTAILFASLVLLGASNQPMPAALAGDWIQIKGDIRTEEHWGGMQDGAMVGSSLRIGGNRKTWEETMRIVADADGRYVLHVSQGGEAEVRFPMVRRSSTEILFANPAHDYPQRIRYWREGPLLKAEISLADGSRPANWEYQPQ
jgi:hypothetical protein